MVTSSWLCDISHTIQLYVLEEEVEVLLDLEEAQVGVGMEEVVVVSAPEVDLVEVTVQQQVKEEVHTNTWT